MSRSINRPKKKALKEAIKIYKQYLEKETLTEDQKELLVQGFRRGFKTCFNKIWKEGLVYEKHHDLSRV